MEILELQPGQRVVERGLVDVLRGQVLHIEVERHAAVDGRQPVAVLRGLLAVLQLGARTLLMRSSSMFAYTPSSVPKSCSSCMAVFSPMPGTPGCCPRNRP